MPRLRAAMKARGTIVRSDPGALAPLAKEAEGILRALDAPADAAGAEADYVLALVTPEADLDADALVDLTDRAAAVLALASEAPDGRAAVQRAKKVLRARGAFVGPRELVFAPDQFGYLGLESDGARERLEILLAALVHDAERLRLKREGWEEP